MILHITLLVFIAAALKVVASHLDVSADSYVNCYSCMSTTYLSNWEILGNHFYPPLDYTDNCAHPDHQGTARVRTEKCHNACVTVAEQLHIGGVPIGLGYMRGCSERLLLFHRHPDSALWSALKHERHQWERCRVTSWSTFLDLDVKKTGVTKGGVKQKDDVKDDATSKLDEISRIDVCACWGDECNKSEHQSPRK